MAIISEINSDPTPSEERLLDAIEIEAAAAKLSRPTARMHLEALAKKLRKESDALKRVEASQKAKAEAVDDEEMIVVEDCTKDSHAPEGDAYKDVEMASGPPPQRSTQPHPPPSWPAKYVPITTLAFEYGQ